MSRTVMQQALDVIELRAEYDDTYPPRTRSLNDCAIVAIALRAELAKPEAGWMPIESAPMHVEVMVWREDCGAWIAANTSIDAYQEDGDPEDESWFSVAGRHEGDEAPTHWMPLPPPPQ